MALPKSIRIRELGPREGFQTLATSVPTELKLKLIKALNRTGVNEIEVTSFVRADKVPQMADAEEVARQFERQDRIRYTALYLNEQGFRRAEASRAFSNQGWIYIAASETFLKRNNNLKVQEVVEAIPKWLDLFEQYEKRLEGLMISTAFGCNYEGRVSEDTVSRILGLCLKPIKDRGLILPEISLADTMGWAVPTAVSSLLRRVRPEHPESNFSLHLHDTRGAGIASVYAGLLEGIEIFDGSVAGMGGCPFAKGAAGNVATEDIVYLAHEMGIKTGISLPEYVEAAKLAETIVGHPLPGKYYKSF